MVPWGSADYLWGVYYCTWNDRVHVARACRDLTSALLPCPAGCDSAGHDLLAPGAAAEEVGVLQQPGRGQTGQPHLPHPQRLLQRSRGQRQPRYVGNLSGNRGHGSLQRQFINTGSCALVENSLKTAFSHLFIK